MYTIEKTKKISSENGYTLVDVFGNRSVAFLAKGLPENAVIDSVSVNGEHLKDMFDIDEGESVPNVEYLRKKNFDEHRVVAVLNVEEGKGGKKLHQLASIHEINEFTVHYHEVAVAEG